MSAENPQIERPIRRDDVWPAPKQLISWLTIVAIICGGVLFVANSVFASKDEVAGVKGDVRDLSTDVKYIRASVDALANQINARRSP